MLICWKVKGLINWARAAAEKGIINIWKVSTKNTINIITKGKDIRIWARKEHNHEESRRNGTREWIFERKITRNQRKEDRIVKKI